MSREHGALRDHMKWLRDRCVAGAHVGGMLIFQCSCLADVGGKVVLRTVPNPPSAMGLGLRGGGILVIGT